MCAHRPTALIAIALGLAIICPLPALAQALDPPPQAAEPPRGTPPYLVLASDRSVGAPAPTPGHRPTGTAGKLADWIAATDNNGDMPFLIVDKLGARIFAFDVDGRFLGSAPVLVGLARGDDSAPGVGGRKLAAISPTERTTPAGRFVARYGDSNGHGVVLWVDYADAISLHPVMSVSPSEHRQRRIKSADPAEHRISYGCINVPASFYQDVVQPAFGGDGGVVYVMPDTKPLDEVFPRFAAAVGDVTPHPRPHRRSRCDEPGDASGRIPEAEPSRICPVDDRVSMRAPPF